LAVADIFSRSIGLITRRKLKENCNELAAQPLPKNRS
jgi:hypothetical protein